MAPLMAFLIVAGAVALAAVTLYALYRALMRATEHVFDLLEVKR